MTEMQKQFEDWCGNKPLKTDKNEVGLYKYVSTDYAWQAWQASRAAIVVSLPDWSEYDTPRQAIEACKDSLIHAGVGHSYD